MVSGIITRTKDLTLPPPLGTPPPLPRTTLIIGQALFFVNYKTFVLITKTEQNREMPMEEEEERKEMENVEEDGLKIRKKGKDFQL